MGQVSAFRGVERWVGRVVAERVGFVGVGFASAVRRWRIIVVVDGIGRRMVDGMLFFRRYDMI